jgi:heptosyltransferase II
MKILILALSGIGDALMFTPALHLMRRELPDAQIDALVMFGGVKDMYERNPDINSVIHYEFIKKGLPASMKFLSGLRKKYDVSINVYPSNRKEYNVINYLIGAEQRGGVRYLRMDRQNFGRLNNVRITEDDTLHNVQENIRLVSKLISKELNEEPPLYFYLNNEDEHFAEDYSLKLGIGNNEFVTGFHPGCATLKNHEKRRWEPEKFALLAGKLIKEHKSKILIFGGPEEDGLKNNIASMINDDAVTVVSTGNLAQTAAVMKKCSIFVSNDSSLMHVAAAMKLKTVAIIGPTNPAYIHPWKTEYRIASLYLDCAPCFIYSPRPLICFRDDVEFKCIKELDVELVYAKVKELISYS